MAEQSRGEGATLSQGEPYSPGGDFPSGRRNFSFFPPLSKGTHIFRDPVAADGTRSVGTQFSEGPVSEGVSGFGKGPSFTKWYPSERDRARIEAVVAIQQAGLSDDQECVAHIVWVLRGLAGSTQVKSLSEWTVDDVIAFARVAVPAVSL